MPIMEAGKGLKKEKAMLGTRIVVIFSEFSDLDSLVDTVLDVLAQSASPFGLRFALPEGFEAVLEELPPELGGQIGTQPGLFFYKESLGLAGVCDALTDETHFLSLKGEHTFQNHWDKKLFRRYRRVQKGKPALLTAVVSSQEEGLPPQAYLPALKNEFAEDAVRLGRGLPLVAAAWPVRTLVVNPAVVFGSTDYLQKIETKSALLSFAAFAAGYSVYAVEVPLFCPRSKPKMRWLEQPGPGLLIPTHLQRFEQSAGFSFEKRKVGVRASLGLFTLEDDYAQKLPWRLKAIRRMEEWLARVRRSKIMFVTAFYHMPEAFKPTKLYTIRLSYLKAIKSLPLTLYAGGKEEHLLKKGFPNTFSYPDNALLPKGFLQEGMTALQHFKRNKLPLLARVSKSYPGFSHFAWVNCDILQHPVPAASVPNFSHLTDETIHLAVVEGVPDGSMMVVPQKHLKLLSREVHGLTQVDAAIKRSFSEESMLLRLLEKYPDLFTLHDMPQKHLLFATGLEPEFLEEETKRLLPDLLPEKREKWPAAQHEQEESYEES